MLVLLTKCLVYERFAVVSTPTSTIGSPFHLRLDSISDLLLDFELLIWCQKYCLRFDELTILLEELYQLDLVPVLVESSQQQVVFLRFFAAQELLPLFGKHAEEVKLDGLEMVDCELGSCVL